MSTTTADCEHCNEGLVERFSDHLDHRGEHYTRDWTEPCEHCDGTGHVDAAEAIDADVELALFVGAATEAPPTALHLACQEYLDAGHGDPSRFASVQS